MASARPPVRHRGMTLSGLARVCLVLAAMAGAATIAVGAFAIGLTGELQRRLVASETLVPEAGRIAAALGHGGFLEAYRAYLEDGAPDARGAMQAHEAAARAALEALRARASGMPGAEDPLRTLGAVMGLFSRAAAFDYGAPLAPGAAPPPTLARLDRAAQAAAEAGDALARIEVLARYDALTRAFNVGGAALVLALVAIGAGGVAMTLILRLRVLGPLDAVQRAVSGAASGNHTQPIWGVSRADEFGALARAADALRLQAAAAPDWRRAEAEGRLRLTLEGTGGVVFDKTMSGVGEVMKRLEAEAADLAGLAQRAETRIADALRRAEAACAEAERAAEASRGGGIEASRVMRAAADDLLGAGRAAIAELSGAAQRLGADADTMGARMDRALDGVGEAADRARGLSGELDRACAAIRDLARRIEPEFVAAVGAVRLAGETLDTRLGAADAGLADVLAALRRVETALSATLGKAGATLDQAANAAARAAAHWADEAGRRGAAIGAAAEAIDARAAGLAAAESRLSDAAEAVSAEQVRLARAGADAPALGEKLAALGADVRAAVDEAARRAAFNPARDAALREDLAQLADEIRTLAQRREAEAGFETLRVRLEELVGELRPLARLAPEAIEARLSGVEAQLRAHETGLDAVQSGLADLRDAVAALGEGVVRAPDAETHATLTGVSAALDRIEAQSAVLMARMGARPDPDAADVADAMARLDADEDAGSGSLDAAVGALSETLAALGHSVRSAAGDETPDEREPGTGRTGSGD